MGVWKKVCACDISGVCPYGAGDGASCEYWCGTTEPEDYPSDYYGDEEDEEQK